MSRVANICYCTVKGNSGYFFAASFVTNLENGVWFARRYCLWGRINRFRLSLILKTETAEDLRSKGNWLTKKSLR